MKTFHQPSRAVASRSSAVQGHDRPVKTIVNNRPGAAAQRKLQQVINRVVAQRKNPLSPSGGGAAHRVLQRLTEGQIDGGGAPPAPAPQPVRWQRVDLTPEQRQQPLPLPAAPPAPAPQPVRWQRVDLTPEQRQQPLPLPAAPAALGQQPGTHQPVSVRQAPTEETLIRAHGPLLPGFTPNDYLFASVRNGEDNQPVVGSIYFTGGRIRLEHSGNPLVEAHDQSPSGPARPGYYVVTDQGQAQGVADEIFSEAYGKWHSGQEPNAFKLPVSMGILAPFTNLTDLPPNPQAFIELYGPLTNVEFTHPSRGVPGALPVTLDQTHINTLITAAGQQSNTHLRQVMNDDPTLSQIRTDPN